MWLGTVGLGPGAAYVAVPRVKTMNSIKFSIVSFPSSYIFVLEQLDALRNDRML